MKTVNFFEQVKRLACSSFSFKKYKLMKAPIAALICVFLSPFMILQIALFFLLFPLAFLFNLLQAPIKFLHGILNEEGQQLRGGAQFIIYFFSWPIVFSLYIAVSVITLALYFLYAFASLLGYIWSLCAYKFHLNITEESIDVEPKPISTILSGVHLAILVILFIPVVAYFACVPFAQNLYVAIILEVVAGVQGVQLLFNIIFVPIAYKNEKPTIEEKQ